MAGWQRETWRAVQPMTDNVPESSRTARQDQHIAAVIQSLELNRQRVGPIVMHKACGQEYCFEASFDQSDILGTQIRGGYILAKSDRIGQMAGLDDLSAIDTAGRHNRRSRVHREGQGKRRITGSRHALDPVGR